MYLSIALLTNNIKPVLRSILFTLLYAGLIPRLASEKSDSLEQRIEKILRLIKECKYSIHDLSRVKSKKANQFSRLNMPFELGIDWMQADCEKPFTFKTKSYPREETIYSESAFQLKRGRHKESLTIIRNDRFRHFNI